MSEVEGRAQSAEPDSSSSQETSSSTGFNRKKPARKETVDENLSQVGIAGKSRSQEDVVCKGRSQEDVAGKSLSQKKGVVGKSSSQGEVTEQQISPQQKGVSRRSFVAGAAGAVVMLGIGGVGVLTAKDESILRPPGGQDERHYIGSCIRCDRCRSACPRNVIEVCGIEAGFVNMRTARLDYRSGRITSGFEYLRSFDNPYDGLLALEGSGFCDFCDLCIKNCPTGALQSFDPATEWIGEAVIVADLCIAFDKKGGCRKCVDYCPFDAIVLDDDLLPVVVPEKCCGCGICENICPTNSYRTFTGLSERGVIITPTAEGRPHENQ